MKYLEITEHAGEGYKPLVSFNSWRVAVINYSESFDKKNFCRMEKHQMTDEVFILLTGNAELVIGGNGQVSEEIEIYKMEKQKVYNVKRDVWHHIFVSRDASVIIVENDNTCKENTVYIPARLS